MYVDECPVLDMLVIRESAIRKKLSSPRALNQTKSACASALSCEKVLQSSVQGKRSNFSALDLDETDKPDDPGSPKIFLVEPPSTKSIFSEKKRKKERQVLLS